MIYYVMSIRFSVENRPSQKAGEEVPSIETKRTDRKTAESDVDIIKTILGRKAWIEESDDE